MDKGFQMWWDRRRAGWARRSRVGRATLWLLLVFCLGMVGATIHVATGLDTLAMTLSSIALMPLVVILLFRWLTHRVLWKVRNRLVLTYLLVGLTPAVLFVMLGSMAAYVLAGQYATDMGMAQLTQGLTRVRDQAGSAVVFGSQGAAASAAVSAKKSSTDNSGGTDDTNDMSVAESDDAAPLSLMELKGNTWAPLDGADAKAAAGPLTSGAPPAWLHPGFQGIVENNRLLYLCAEVSTPRNGRTVVVLASRPLTRDEMNGMAKGLGRILLSEGYSKLAADKDDDGEEVPVGAHEKVRVEGPSALLRAVNFNAVSSVPLTAAKHPYLDPPVVFSPATLPVTEWQTGNKLSGMLAVISRPTLLYGQLFASSVQLGKVMWAILIGIAMFFAMLEVFALLMASSLSWTITRSVAELYKGTREIDAGHLEHRIPVKRKDQLAALATSFNGMAASVSELLVQQREKERLLNELAIAQEVQTTLFPPSPAALGALEVHGAWLAARTVGGDYFDFVFGLEGGRGAGSVLLALGDISGKGISAALLMSALQSAVRAFSAGCGEVAEGAVSPALMLKMLNEHLYRSTQSARYATLVLAVYEAESRRLTYSNGGHLPPLVISLNGTVRRLDVGGAVVGLLAGLEYEEATVQLEVGDLLVAYTDGLTEPEKAGEDFGEGRLMEYARAHMEEPLTDLARSTLRAVQTWFGEQEQPDDMTIVLARQR